MSAMVLIIVIGLALILLVVAIIYNYMKKTTTPEEDTKKDKIISYMSIGATVVMGVGLIASIWQYSLASRTTAVCLAPSN